MDVFIARQPILDLNCNVYGYEILYRDSEVNQFSESDAEYASGNTLTRCFIDFGISELTNGKKAFINFTGDFLKNDIATIFPHEYMVIEILENIVVNDGILQGCKKLKALGYTLAIDDFAYQAGYDELIKLVDIIKIDFRATPQTEIETIIKKFSRKGLSFLAEKVETREEYDIAVKMGFRYFQGYFFAHPEINKKKKFIAYKESRLRLIKMLNSENPEFEDISKLIEGDLAFSYEILKLVNSAYYGRINKLQSVRFALVLLGLDEIKKWLYLAFISDLRQEQPEEIINISMLRGKFLENMAYRANKPQMASELLTVGMFSTIDLLLNKPMPEALEELRFSDNIKNVLSGKDTTGFMARCYHIILKYEQGQWDDAANTAAALNITVFDMNQAYIDSLKWMQTLKRT
jgi:c-di-GMP-related signal transduction protein